MNKLILINGSTAKTGGGKQILFSLIEKINEYGNQSGYKFVILVPDKSEFVHIKKKYISFKQIPKVFNKSFLVPLNNCVTIPLIIKNNSIKIVFNLGDIPLRTNCNQVMLFDWPYAIYEDKEVWRLMPLKEKFLRKFKLYVFKKLIKYVDCILAQTEVTKSRLQERFKINDIKIFPNAVAIDHFKVNKSNKSLIKLSKKFNLLCLSAYYIHKNLEIFLKVGKILKEKNIHAKIFITIDKNQNKKARKLLRDIDNSELADYLENLGSIKLANVPNLYKRVDALILPTLLESFSGTYVEAMWNKKIILTSDKDFARIVCGENAYYFNPLDADDICMKIEKAINHPSDIENKVESAYKNVNNMPNWDSVYFSMINIFKETIK